MTPSSQHVWGVLTLILAGIVLALGAVHALAEWKPEYAQAPQHVRDWYKNAELTEGAKKRFPFKNCCDHADVVHTQFRVSKSAGANDDEWYWLDRERWRRIPDDIIHWGRSAPGGQPTLFVYSGVETCFFPGEGGL